MKDVLIHENVINFSIGEESYSLYLSYYKKNKKKILALVEKKEVINTLQEIEYQEGVNYAIALLSRKSYSSFEIQKKLATRIFSSIALDQIITFLYEKKYLNDDADIERFLDSLIRKGVGPFYALQKLKAKFNKNFTINEIEAVFTQEIQQEIIAKLIKKKTKGKDPKDRKTQSLVYRYLQSRGFDGEIIIKSYRFFYDF